MFNVNIKTIPHADQRYDKQRVCTRCLNAKDPSAFYPSTRDGIKQPCIDCRKAINRDRPKKTRKEEVERLNREVAKNGLSEKLCIGCDVVKPISSFYKQRHGTPTGKCKDCIHSYQRERARTWYHDQQIVNCGVSRRKLRAETIAAYGGRCACCGEDADEFLQIDHVLRDGKQHRQQIKGSILNWLKQHGFPKDRFRLLCSNCNHALGVKGYCPHSRESVSQWIGGC